MIALITASFVAACFLGRSTWTRSRAGTRAGATGDNGNGQLGIDNASNVGDGGHEMPPRLDITF